MCVVVACLVTLAAPGVSSAQERFDPGKYREQTAKWIDYQADKDLTAEDATALVNSLLVLVDRQQPIERRYDVITKVGLQIPHRAAIPALVQVINDQKDSSRVRYAAITTLAQINDRRALDALIDSLRSPERTRAQELLLRHAGERVEPDLQKFRLNDRATSEDVEASIRFWRIWWGERPSEFGRHRARMLFD